MTQSQIAAALGISTRSIARYKKRAPIWFIAALWALEHGWRLEENKCLRTR